MLSSADQTSCCLLHNCGKSCTFRYYKPPLSILSNNRPTLIHCSFRPSPPITHNQTRKWKASSIICQGRVERPRLPFCKLVTSTTWRYHLKCWDLCHEGSCLSVLKSHFKSTSSCLSEVVSSKAGVFIVHSPVNLLPSLCWSLLYCLSFFSPPLAEHDNTTTMHEDLEFRWQYTS